MNAKQLLKLIYEAKNTNADIVDSMIDFKGVHIHLNKEELEGLANKLEEVES